MNAKECADVLRLQSEHLQKLVMQLTAKLTALEQRVVIDDSASDALTPILMGGLGELSKNIAMEAERLQNYIQEVTDKLN